MSRLTCKPDKVMKNYYYETTEETINEDRISILNKLGQLEDIEEEIGIDLIEAVELCKQVNIKKVVYIKEEWGIDTLKILDELDIELFNHRLYSKCSWNVCIIGLI